MNDIMEEFNEDGFTSAMGKFIHKLLRCCYLAPTEISCSADGVIAKFTDGSGIIISEKSFRELAALPDSAFSQALIAYIRYEPMATTSSVLQNGNAD